MKKVLLAGSMNPHNKGDQARVKATIKKLTEYKDISLAILSNNFYSDKAVYSEDAVEIIKAPWAGPSIRLTRLTILALITLLEYLLLSIFRRFLIPRIRIKLYQYDTLAIASGIDFSDYAGRLPIYYAFFLILLFAIIMRKPVMCYAQSIGPVKCHTLRKLTRFFLNQVHTISVREENSLAFLRELRVTRPIIHRTADPAFLLQPSSGKPIDILVKFGIKDILRPLIGISLSPTPFAGPESGYCTMGLWYKINTQNAEKLFNYYIKKMTYLCDRLISIYKATLIFIPNCSAEGDDDRVAISEVYGRMYSKENAICFTSDFHLSASMEIIGACDIFIGTRLHTDIMAALMGVPVIPLVGTNGPRIPSIMKMIGMDKYIRNIVTDEENQIMETIDEVWNTRESLRKMVRSRVNDLQEKALMNVHILRELCFLGGDHYPRYLR